MQLLEDNEKTNMLLGMLKIRLFEEKFCELRNENILSFGQAHLGIGEEAVYVGVCSALSNEDIIVGTHRSHGYAIAKGSNMKSLMAELFGKITGCNHGKGGTLHFADVSKGVLGSSGIVGGGVPIGVGAALAIQINGENKAVVAFFGDGAANEGVVHESMNLASIWKLPILFVCENNGYAISVSTQNGSSVDSFSVRARGYNMRGYEVDGQDVESVRTVCATALEGIKNGYGPALIECKTRRFCDHCGITYPNMNKKYDDRGEVNFEYWDNNEDPILIYVKKLCDEHVIDIDIFRQMYMNISSEVEEAVQYSISSPYPQKDDLFKDMYVYCTEKWEG